MFGGAIAMQTQIMDWIEYFYMDNYYLKILVEMGYPLIYHGIIRWRCLIGKIRIKDWVIYLPMGS